MKIGTRVTLNEDIENSKGQKFKKGLFLTVVGNDTETVHLKSNNGRMVLINKSRMFYCVKKVR